MTREIKFRAKTKKTKRWAYGFYCQAKNLKGKLAHYMVLDGAEIEVPYTDKLLNGIIEIDPETLENSAEPDKQDTDA